MVSNAVAAAQAAATSAISFAVGTVSRAIIEAYATIGLWLQYIILQVLSQTRLATSTGADVDSYLADFGLSRLPAVAATANVTFTSLNPSATSATIAVGAQVQTADGTLVYAVTEDTSNSAWSTTAGAYIRPEGTASVTLPVQCTTTGVSGNVAAGEINLLATQIAGIDTVTNADPASDGQDAETDAAARTRFASWFASRGEATAAAIGVAIANVQNGLDYAIEDQQDATGNYRAGYFTVDVNDGSTVTPAATLTAVNTAVDAARACGVGFAVVSAAVTTANVTGTLVYASGVTAASKVALNAAIVAAIIADIDATAIGAGYLLSRISYIAILTGAGSVTGVTNPEINGADADIPSGQTVRAGTVTLTDG